MSVTAKKARSMPSSLRTAEKAEAKSYSGIIWFTGILFGIFLIVQLGLTWYWSIEPDEFDVIESALEQSEVEDRSQFVTGYIYTSTLIEIGNTLLYKQGGYLSNDVMLPSILLDNMPNWEFGALVMLRDASSALRNHFARHQSQSKENPDLGKAEPALYFENDSWMLPGSEPTYKKGINHLREYLNELQQNTNPNATFFARADNLSQYLQIVEKRLGSISHRLNSSSVQKHQFHQNVGRSVVSTPWMEVDDVLFEARGSMWALLHIFKAIKIEFEPILRNKNALESMVQIIKELADTQGSLLSPVVLNGNGFGIFANYSLTMANFITRANAATIDLRSLMIRG